MHRCFMRYLGRQQSARRLGFHLKIGYQRIKTQMPIHLLFHPIYLSTVNCRGYYSPNSAGVVLSGCPSISAARFTKSSVDSRVIQQMISAGKSCNDTSGTASESSGKRDVFFLFQMQSGKRFAAKLIQMLYCGIHHTIFSLRHRHAVRDRIPRSSASSIQT